MVREEPGFIGKFLGIFDPGGDPDAVDRGGDAVSRLADQMRSSSQVLSASTAQTLDHWVAGEARDAYRDISDRFAKMTLEYAEHLQETAEGVHELADLIRDLHRQARDMALLAASIAAASAASLIIPVVGEVVAASGLAEIAVITSGFWAMMARAALFVAKVVYTVIKVLKFTQAMRWGMAISWTGAVMSKLINGVNPLDPGNWTANDISNIIIGGILANGMYNFSGFLKGQAIVRDTLGTGLLPRMAVNGVASFGGGATGTAINQLWLQDKPLTWGTAGTILEVGGIAAVLGAGLRPLRWSGGRPTGPIIAPVPGAVMGRSDYSRQFTGIPTGIAYWLINGSGGGDTPVTVKLPPPAPTAPDHLPPLTPVAPPWAQQPSSSGSPRAFTVERRGESLSAIAQRVYGDASQFPLIAEANNIDPPYTIYRGQILVIPSAPARTG